jgi:hypothetical protein
MYGFRSRDNADGILTGLRIGRPTGGPSPGRSTDLPAVQKVQTVSGAHLPLYSMGTEGCCPWVKPLGREADHSHMEPRLRMSGALLVLSPKCLHDLQRYNFSLTVYGFQTWCPV